MHGLLKNAATKKNVITGNIKALGSFEKSFV
jgi:hypothetical protein